VLFTCNRSQWGVPVEAQARYPTDFNLTRDSNRQPVRGRCRLSHDLEVQEQVAQERSHVALWGCCHIRRCSSITLRYSEEGGRGRARHTRGKSTHPADPPSAPTDPACLSSVHMCTAYVVCKHVRGTTWQSKGKRTKKVGWSGFRDPVTLRDGRTDK
jgi:hypothetical protein